MQRHNKKSAPPRNATHYVSILAIILAIVLIFGSYAPPNTPFTGRYQGPEPSLTFEQPQQGVPVLIGGGYTYPLTLSLENLPPTSILFTLTLDILDSGAIIDTQTYTFLGPYPTASATYVPQPDLGFEGWVITAPYAPGYVPTLIGGETVLTLLPQGPYTLQATLEDNEGHQFKQKAAFVIE